MQRTADTEANAAQSEGRAVRVTVSQKSRLVIEKCMHTGVYFTLSREHTVTGR